MKSTATPRKLWLGTALLLTLAATAYFWINDGNTVDEADFVVAAAAPQPPGEVNSKQNIAKAPADQLPARALQAAGRDIFAVPRRESEPEQKESAPPPPPLPPQVRPPILPALPVVPPPPTAPPLPFIYIGKLGEEGQYTVFLSARGRNFAVKAGEVVAQVYRIEEIKPPMMTMTYLPMKIKQTMQIGEAN